MYFEKAKNLDELKKKYRELAFANHPDRGGDTATMQAINAEYDLMHASLLNVWAGGSQKEESGADFRRSFYEEQGWTGERYNRDLSMDAITKSFAHTANPIFLIANSVLPVKITTVLLLH